MNRALEDYLISRRRVLQGMAATTAGAVLGRPALAAPGKPITFIGWQPQHEEHT